MNKPLKICHYLDLSEAFVLFTSDAGETLRSGPEEQNGCF